MSNAIFNLYDFKQYYTELEHYLTWYDIFNAAETKEEKDKLKKSKPAVAGPKIRPVDFSELDLVMATATQPVKIGDKYSVDATLANIKDENVQWMLKYFAKETSRGRIIYNSATKDTRHCALVPLYLAAHKEYNGIQYEDWSKDDKMMRFAVGYKLWDDIQDWKDVPLSEELRIIARANALRTPKGKVITPQTWPLHNINLDSSTKLRPTTWFRHVWLQTWVANVEYRNEYMILDYNNWDLVPKALDAVFTPEPELEIKSKKIEEELPW